MYLYAEGLVVEGSEGDVHIAGGLRDKERYMVLIIYLPPATLRSQQLLACACRQSNKQARVEPQQQQQQAQIHTCCLSPC